MDGKSFEEMEIRNQKLHWLDIYQKRNINHFAKIPNKLIDNTIIPKVRTLFMQRCSLGGPDEEERGNIVIAVL